MKKRRLILIMIGLFAAVVVTVFIWPGEREPEYQGKKLSEWLTRYSMHSYDIDSGSNGTEHEEAAEAVRHIGTNALPFLLGWIAYETPPLKEELYTKIGKFTQDSDQESNLVNSLMSNRERKGMLARVGFEVLGSQAAPAIPELRHFIKGTNSLAFLAVYALGEIGESAVPTLVCGLTNQSRFMRIHTCVTLLKFSHSTNAPLIAEALVDRLEEQDSRVVVMAASTLGQLKDQAKIAVPALTRVLQARDVGPRVAACYALGQFGAKGAEAVPLILPMLNYTNLGVRRAATNALSQIAPELLPSIPPPQDAKQ